MHLETWNMVVVIVKKLLGALDAFRNIIRMDFAEIGMEIGYVYIYIYIIFDEF